MASGLPADLVVETRLTLDSVGRVTLSPQAWPAVQRSLARADSAVDADDAAELRHALDELHRIGLDAPDYGLPAGGGAMPAAPYGSSAGYTSPPPPPAPKQRSWGRVAWIVGALIAIGVVVVVALGLLATRSVAPRTAPPAEPTVSGTGTASPTTVGPTTRGLEPRQGGGPSTAAPAVAGGLIALAVVVLFAVVLVRRRTHRPYTPVHVAPVAERPPPRPVVTFAPNEIVELANRTVDRLVAKGGGP